MDKSTAVAVLVLAAVFVVAALVQIIRYGKKLLYIGGAIGLLAVILVYGFASLAQAQATKAAATAATAASAGQSMTGVLWAVFALFALLAIAGGPVALVVFARRRGVDLGAAMAALVGQHRPGPASPTPPGPARPVQQAAALPQVIVVYGGGEGIPQWLVDLVGSDAWQGGTSEGGPKWIERG